MISVGLFLVGIFVTYIAIFDESLFNIVLQAIGSDRLGVTISITVAAAVPMFFAVGMIRKGVSKKWFTIYQYESMLNWKGFWVLAIIFLIIIISLHLGNIIFGLIFSPDINIVSSLTIIGCIISSIYLIRYISKKDKKRYDTMTY